MGRPAVLKIDIVADAKGVGKGVDDASGKLGKLGKVAGPVGAAVGAGLALGVGALAAFGASAVAAASSAEQSMGAVQSVFGQASAAVVKFADDSADRLGLSKNAYMELASVVGAQLKNMGRSQAEASVETDQLISLGADLAATFGGSVSDAVGAVGSLLRGERDPIERYGIAIKDADVKARLAAEGNDKLTGAARKTAEATATLSLLTEQASGSVGAFGRESDTLAGKQERLKARFEDVKAALGERLLPIVTRFADFLLVEGVPALERFGRWVENNRAFFIEFGATTAQVLLTLGRGLLEYAALALDNNARLVGAFGGFLRFFFEFADNLLAAAESAFGWLPGVGDKVGKARASLGELAGTADAKLKAVEGAMRRGADAARGAADSVGNLKNKVDSLKSKALTVTVNYKVNGANRVVGVGGGLSEFSAVPLGGHSPQLVGGYSGGLRGGGGLTTAAAGDGLDDGLASYTVRGGTVVVDRRTIDARVTVQGALDPVAVARQLEDVLAGQARRLGRTSTLTGAR